MSCVSLCLRSAALVWYGLLFSMLVQPANAGMILKVDPVQKELWFTGSDSGTISHSGSYNVEWKTPGLVTSSQQVSVASALSLTTTPPGLVFSSFFSVGQSGDMSLYLFADASSGTNRNLQITGNGTHISYASLSSGYQTLLEAAAANSVTMSLGSSYSGSGFASVSLQTASGGAVPEPTSMAIFGLGALGLAYHKRRKIKA
jgi:hypothetical protein